MVVTFHPTFDCIFIWTCALGKWVWQGKQTPHCNFPYLRPICTHVTPYNTSRALQIIRLQSISKCASSICQLHPAQWSQGGWIEIRTLSKYFSQGKICRSMTKGVSFQSGCRGKGPCQSDSLSDRPTQTFQSVPQTFQICQKNLITAWLVGGWVGWIGFQGLNLW